VNLATLPETATRPDELFKCARFRCGMLAKRCVERQVKRDAAAQDGEHRVPYELRECNTDTCAQGRAIRVALPEHVAQLTNAASSRSRVVERRESDHARCEWEPCARIFRRLRKDSRFCSVACSNKWIRAHPVASRHKAAPPAAPRPRRPPPPATERECSVCRRTYSAVRSNKPTRGCSLDCKRAISARVRTAATMAAMLAMGKRCAYEPCSAPITHTRDAAGCLSLWLHKRRRFCDMRCSNASLMHHLDTGKQEAA
jgi:hypothetical protein